MITLIGLSGSLRRASYNTALLRNAALLMPPDSRLIVHTLHGIPLYDGDVEAEHGVPAAALALQDAIEASDGLVLATPEYNNGIPGVFKNGIDWLSRPPVRLPKVFGGRPVAMLGASPGGFGTILAHDAWLPVLRTLGTAPWFGPRMLVSKAHEAIAADGQLKSDALREQLRAWLQGFVDHLKGSRAQ